MYAIKSTARSRRPSSTPWYGEPAPDMFPKELAWVTSSPTKMWCLSSPNEIFQIYHTYYHSLGFCVRYHSLSPNSSISSIGNSASLLTKLLANGRGRSPTRYNHHLEPSTCDRATIPSTQNPQHNNPRPTAHLHPHNPHRRSPLPATPSTPPNPRHPHSTHPPHFCPPTTPRSHRHRHPYRFSKSGRPKLLDSVSEGGWGECGGGIERVDWERGGGWGKGCVEGWGKGGVVELCA